MSDLQAMFDSEMERRLSGPDWGPSIREPFLALCGMIRDTVASGGTIFICGNGGSAAQAQHFAAELVGRFKRERRGISAIALSVDTSIVTSIANDYGFEQVFERQVQSLMHPGDLLLGLSTSGTSPNVVRALRWAHEQDYTTAALTGAGGGELLDITDVCVTVPSTETDLIQEHHLILIHILADVAERTVESTL
ncbi:SIS domain-containing protein [Gemmatimonadota bacterium]